MPEPDEKKDPVVFRKIGPYGRIVSGGVFRRNPVLVRALALAPVLAASVALKNGLLLAGVTFLVLTATAVAASLLVPRLPRFLSAATLILVAAAVTTPLCMLSDAYAPNVAASVGVFLPLTAVNGVILSRAEQFQSRSKVLAALCDGAANGLGFALAILLLSVMREVLGGGTLYGRPLPGMSSVALSLLQAPAGGFFLLAFLMAAVQYARLRRARRAERDAAGKRHPGR